MYNLNTKKKFFLNLINIIFSRKLWFYNDIGNKFIDTSSGPMTVNIGYCSYFLIKHLINKIIKINFSYRYQFKNYDSEILSKKIIKLSNNTKNKIFFLNGGSEASEVAYKISLDYFKNKGLLLKQYLIGRFITNHGNTFLSLSYGDDRIRKNLFSYKKINPEFFNIKIIQCYCYQCPLNKNFKSCKLECILNSIKIINYFGKEKIASIILEPITGSSGGCLIPHKKYFLYLKFYLKKNNILLITDEIVNAFYRLGNWFFSDKFYLISDISIVGKGLGSGYYPISGILISDFINKIISFSQYPILFGHTYTNNTFSSSISFYILKFLEIYISKFCFHYKYRLINNIFYKIFLKLIFIANFRIYGFLSSLETILDINFFDFFINFGYNIGISLYVCRSSGRNKNILTLLFTPTLIISENDIWILLKKIYMIFIIIFID